jgi:hypothetical protein
MTYTPYALTRPKNGTIVYTNTFIFFVIQNDEEKGCTSLVMQLSDMAAMIYTGSGEFAASLTFVGESVRVKR